MPVGLAWTVALCAIGVPSPVDSPLAWSANGEWIAFTVSVEHSPARRLPARWLFQADQLNDEPVESGQPAGDDRADGAYCLWATRAEAGDSVLLERSRGPLSAPCWSPDGRALAFARLVPLADDRGRYEVVVQDEPDRQRVILSRTVGGRRMDFIGLSRLAPAWSPDGRLIAVPFPQQTLDLAVLRADNGRLLKVFPDCGLAAWSPDAKNPALAFVRGGERPTLQWVDGSFGAARTLAELGQTTQPPVWLDGSSLAVVVGAAGRRGALHGLDQFHLARVALDTGAAQPIVSLSSNPGDGPGKLRGPAFAYDRERENLFYTRATLTPPYEIVWSRPRHNEILKPFFPYDFTIATGALAVSPDNRLLAFRAGGAGSEALPAVVELSDDRLSPTALVPDDEVRVRWVSTLIRTARRLLFVGLPPAKLKDGPEVERATVLPLPGEIAPQQELLARLRRLGRLGRPLCDRPPGAAPAGPGVEELLDEARLFFDYLRQDYDAALHSLDALEARLTDSDARLRLLAVRAQIYVAQGRGDEARETIDYLLGRQRRAAESIEDTPLGPEVRSVADPVRGWPRYLSERSEAYLKAVQKPAADDESPHNPFGNQNPDAPDGGLPNGPIAPRRPRVFPFAPGGPVPRLEGAPDVVLPPGGVMIPPQPPAPPRDARRR